MMMNECNPSNERIKEFFEKVKYILNHLYVEVSDVPTVILFCGWYRKVAYRILVTPREKQVS
jgi:hypothetical protein